MPPPDEARRLDPRRGLCPECACVRQIVSAKGSVFWMCEKARDDERFPRYPVQPRLVCEGFERRASSRQ
jgi:hypothetical protein